jgi:hypothetical protein
VRRFLLGVLVIDALVLVGFGAGVPRSRAPAGGAAGGSASGAAPVATETGAPAATTGAPAVTAAGTGAGAVKPLVPSSTAAVPAGATPPRTPVEPVRKWSGVDAAELGKKVGGIYLAIRRQIGRNKRVVLQPPRRVGDDVEIHVALGTQFGYPPSLYCFRCEAQKCLFSDGATAGLEVLATAVPMDDVRALVKSVGREHVLVTYVGGASAGPVVTKAEVQTCEDGKPTTEVRFPMDYDSYDDAECGTHECELLGSGKRVQIDGGRIDSNEKLACLRAACLKQADTSDVPVKFAGELAFEQGQAYRGAEVVVAVRGIGADKDAYGAFWGTLTGTIGGQP